MNPTNSTSAAPSHSLDNPAWEALTTLQAHFAEGDELAKRYPAAMFQIVAVREPSDDAFRSLVGLLGPGAVAGFFSAGSVDLPPAFQKLEEFDVRQMIFPNPPPEAEEDGVRKLTAEDVPEMLRLIEQTKPGPFGPRTYEMGTYLGIHHAGKLVAMAGERLRLTGFTEVSAVCTDPEHRGHGYASRLVSILVRRIATRGETPFLHVRADNDSAFRVYEKLGFETRRFVRIAIIRSAW
ncbi:MAG: GNAT family N-acetyltransferase [Acidobacteriota bacterium]|nr:GNAT family N-acetyltransferase [Acidobacteriota bacterium]